MPLLIFGSCLLVLSASDGNRPSRLLIEPAEDAALLGHQESIPLAILAPGFDDPHALPFFAVNIGRVVSIRRQEPGVFTATFLLPDAGLPTIAVIIAALDTAKGRLFGATSIKLYAQAGVELETTPGARVELWAFGQKHGPLITGPDGRVRFAVETLRPAFEYRYRIAVPGVDPVEGAERVSGFRRASLMTIGPLPQPNELRTGGRFAFAATSVLEGGERTAPGDIECSVGGGLGLVPVEVARGYAVFQAEVPRRFEPTLALSCHDSAGNQIQRALPIALPAEAVILALEAPPTFTAGEPAPRMTLRALARDGTATFLPRDLAVSAELVTSSGRQRLALPPIELGPDETGEIIISVPSQFDGAREVKITVQDRGGGLQQAVTIALRPAEPIGLRISGPPGALAATGRGSMVLSVEVIDRFGNAEPASGEAAAVFGEVQLNGAGEMQYSIPLLRAAHRDTITVRSRGLVREHSLDLAAPAVFELGAAGGVLVTHRGGVAPLATVSAALAQEPICGLVSLGYAESPGSFKPTAEDSTLTVRQDWRALILILKGLYEIDLSAHLLIRLGVGVGPLIFATELEAFRGGQVARPRTEQWAFSMLVGAATGLVIDVGRWGVGVNLDSIYSPAMGGVPETGAVLISVGLHHRWGW